MKAYSTSSDRRTVSLVDSAIMQCDTVLRTLLAGKTASMRSSPATKIEETALTSEERQHSAGLMRVNHTGEVCAQALYQGQALTAKLPNVRRDMQVAAIEEEDHLAWCQERLNQLGTSPSLLNPLWYGLSFGIGASAGLISDKLSLGFVAATEDQVCQHLENHLESLPENDKASQAIVAQMKEDEAEHSAMAKEAGGITFPPPVKKAMSQLAKVMTWASYRL